MPAPDEKIPLFPVPEAFSALLAPKAPAADYRDLERRVADLEERAQREDRERAARDRLKELGLVLPASAR